MLDAAGEQLGEREFEHSGEGLSQIANLLLSFAAGDAGEVGVAIETPSGPVVESLLEHGFAVHSTNPKQLDCFRDRQGKPWGCAPSPSSRWNTRALHVAGLSLTAGARVLGSRRSMLDWTALGTVATFVLTLITLRLAQATATQAHIMEAQFRVANRPRVRIDWRLPPPSSDEGDRNLAGEMREVIGKPVILHWAKVRVDVDGNGFKCDPTARSVIEYELDSDHVAPIVDTPVRIHQHVDVEVIVSLSTPNVPGTKETCRFTSNLFVDDTDDQYQPTDPHLAVVWQSKATIDADVEICHRNPIADALIRAWRGGR